MTELTLKLDPVTVREATAQAINGLLTPEMRQQMIQSAISALLKPKTDGYGSYKDKSPLQIAFEEAVHQVARETVAEKVREDADVLSAVQAAIENAKQRLINMDVSELGKNIANAVIHSIEVKGRDRY